MSFGWEVTTDDISIVLNRHGIHKSDEELLDLLGRLDTDTIEDAALSGGCDIDEQAEAASQEIETQLKTMMVIH